MISRIDSERLLMREWRESDLDALARLYADEASTRFIGGVKDRNGAWRAMASIAGHWSLKGFGPFAVTLRETGDVAGYCGPWDPAEKADEPEIAYALLPFARGRGLASEAVKAALAYCYERLEWAKACSFIAKENLASIGVARRVGARHEADSSIYGGAVQVQIWRYPAPENLSSTYQPNC